MIDKELLKLLKGEKKYVYILVGLNILQLLLTVLITICICFSFQILIYNSKTSFNDYLPVLIISIVTIITKVILYKLNGNIQSKLGILVKENLRKKIYKKLTELKTSNLNEIDNAKILQVSIEGVEQLDLYYSLFIPQFYYSMISPLILFIIFAFVNIYSAIVLLLLLPLIPIIIIRISKFAKKVFSRYWNQYIKMGSTFLDNIQGLKELKIYNYDSVISKKMDDQAEAFRKVTMKVLIMQLTSITVMDMVAYGGAAIGIVVAFFTAKTDIFFNQIQPTILILFFVLLAVEFFLPLRQLGSAFHISMNGVSSGKILKQILNLEQSSIENKKDIEIKNYSIKMDKLSFLYCDRLILDNISVYFKEKQITAISGISGSGKTTITNILRQQLLNYNGEVFLDNYNLKEVNTKFLYKNIGYISYNSHIFNTSIRQNFYYYNPNIKDEEIYNLIKFVNLDDFMLDKDLDYVIDENSLNISGGQKQRLILAFNLASNKKILILDEATSNIDNQSESIILDIIKKLSKEKTIIFITHRIKNLKIADYIYFIKDQSISEEGSYEDLIYSKKDFYKLYTQQQKLESVLGNGVKYE